MEKTFIIKMGGSLLFEKNTVRIDRLQKLASIFRNSKSIKGVVIGGGAMARVYIKAARELGVNESACDMMGIDISRVNCRLLIGAIGNRAYPKPAHTLEEALEYSISGKIVMMGGITPGQSTTSVTFELAEALNATDVLILTDVDGVYDKDPKKHKDAVKYQQLTINQIETMFISSGSNTQSAAGEYRIMDAISLQIFKRSKLNVQLLSGEDDKALEEILIHQSDKIHGTQFIRV